MNVLLTGAAGLIGMALRPGLEARGHSVTPIDITSFGRNDPHLELVALDDRPALDALVRRAGINAIVHCGAISGPMMAKGEPLKIVAANIDVTATLLDVARAFGMRRFVFCSSISVYGDVGLAVITEATPLRPTSVYGATKVACEQLIRGFAAEYGLDGVSLRIGRVYGPYRRANCSIKALICSAAQDVELEIPCDSTFIYHYVYVEDVVDAALTVLEAALLPNREYNVGSGLALTMPDILQTAASVIPGLRAKLLPGADDVPDRQTKFDISAIAKDFIWKPRYGLAGGISAYRKALLADASSSR